MKFVTQKIHSLLDYPVALALIGLPFILKLGSSHPFAFKLSVIVGIAALLLTILTDHETGLIRVIPYKVHLLVDFLVAVTFIALPLILGFKGIDAIYYWINGVTVLFVVGLHKPETTLQKT